MGLFDIFGDILGLSPPSTSEAMSKEDINWLMEQALGANRTDQQGLFTGYSWDEDPSGKWTQTQSVNDALLPGIERLLGNATQEQGGYESQGFGGLMDALMGQRQQQHGASPRQPQGGGQPPVNYQPPQAGGQQGGSNGQQHPAGRHMNPAAGSGGYWTPSDRNPINDMLRPR